jgi:hypothetical protein
MNEKLKQDHHKVTASAKNEQQQYVNGRGAQFNTKNRFLKMKNSQRLMWKVLMIGKKAMQLRSTLRTILKQ